MLIRLDNGERINVHSIYIDKDKELNIEIRDVTSENAIKYANLFSDDLNISVIKVLNSINQVIKTYNGYNDLVAIESKYRGTIQDILITLKQGDINETIDILKNNLSVMQSSVLQVNNMVKNLSLQINSTVDIDKLTLTEAKEYYINMSKTKLDEFLSTAKLQSSCHNGKIGYYSVSKDKQQLLMCMIQLAAINEGNDKFKISWNESGQPCTYDWTLQELIALASDMEAFVRPYIVKQQQYEVIIGNIKSKEELKNIEIQY